MNHNCKEDSIDYSYILYILLLWFGLYKLYCYYHINNEECCDNDCCIPEPAPEPECEDCSNAVTSYDFRELDNFSGGSTIPITSGSTPILSRGAMESNCIGLISLERGFEVGYNILKTIPADMYTLTIFGFSQADLSFNLNVVNPDNSIYTYVITPLMLGEYRLSITFEILCNSRIYISSPDYSSVISDVITVSISIP